MKELSVADFFIRIAWGGMRLLLSGLQLTESHLCLLRSLFPLLFTLLNPPQFVLEIFILPLEFTVFRFPIIPSPF